MRTFHNLIDSNTQNNGNSRRTSWVRRAGLGAGLAASALVFAACGGSAEPSADETVELKAQLTSMIVDDVGVSESDANCIIDEAFERHEFSELATFATDEPDPEIVDSVTEITVDCLMNGDFLDDELNGEASDGEVSDGEVSDGEPEADQVSFDEGDADADEGADTELPIGEQDADEPLDGPIGGLDEDIDEDEPELEEDPRLESTPEFCGASLAVSEAFAVFEALDPEAGGAAVQATLDLITDRTEAAIRVAPNESLAAAPVAYLEAMENIEEALQSVDYDGSLIGGVDSIRDDVQMVEDINEALDEYLTEICGVPASILDGDAEQIADEFETYDGNGTSADTPEDDSLIDIDDDPSLGWDFIDDARTGIQVEIPSMWHDVDSMSADGARYLVAGPSVVRYDESWLADGVMITAIDANGDARWMEMLNETPAWNECTLEDVQEYDDGAYVGLIHHYTDCGGTGTQAIVVGATDRGLTVDVLVEIQMEDLDLEIVAAILDSFMV